MNIFKKLLPVIIVIVLSYWSVRPLFEPGFFPMHDDTQVARVFEMHKSLSDGMFPVRWVADLGYGYGYPIFNFYAPLAYYIGALFMFLGADALIATKLMIGIGVVLAGVFMYFLAREFWGKAGGIIAGLLYVYAPYHALNIYVRGAVAEFWAYAFIPLAFLTIYKIFINIGEYTDLAANSKLKAQSSKLKLKITKNIWFWVCGSAVAYAAIILSHNLTAMMVTPLLFIFAVILYITLRLREKVHKPYFILLGLLIGILISAFYWLPVLFEMKYTNVLSVVGGGSDYRDHFVCLSQLWNSSWGFGGSAPGCIDGLSFKIGKLHIIMSVVSLLILTPLVKVSRVKLTVITLFTISLLFSVFLTLKSSQLIWDAIPHMAFFQFPWRFLLFVSFFTSFLGGAIFYIAGKIVPSKYQFRYPYWIGCSVVMGAIVIFYVELFIPQKIISVNGADYTNKHALNWTASKLSDEYLPKNFSKPIDPDNVPKDKFIKNKNIKIISIEENTQNLSMVIEAKDQTDLVINIAYFPGWHVFIDGEQVWFKHFNKGLIVTIPEGTHAVSIRFTQTPIEILGNAISVTGVIVLLTGIITRRKISKND